MSLQTLLQPRICELGKIKIGCKEERVRKTSGGVEWRAPVKLDHFVITTMARDAAGDLVPDAGLMASLAEKYGDPDGKLRQIPITLLSDNIDDCIQCAWVWYNGKRVAARSDGETITAFVDFKTGEILPEPRTSPWHDEYADLTNKQGARLFKLHTAFNCVIASSDSRWGGVYKFRTTSRITADQLYGSLIHLQQLTSGVLRGLPLVLVVRPLQVAPDGKTTTIYVVHVELHGPDLQAIQEKALGIAKFQVQHAQEMRRTQIEFRRLLKAPGEEETILDASDIEEEFHPENFSPEEPMASTPKTRTEQVKDMMRTAKPAPTSPEQSGPPTSADPPPADAPAASGPTPSPIEIQKPTLQDCLALVRSSDYAMALDFARGLTQIEQSAIESAIKQAELAYQA